MLGEIIHFVSQLVLRLYILFAIFAVPYLCCWVIALFKLSTTPIDLLLLAIGISYSKLSLSN
jgi:hypothetical protein